MRRSLQLFALMTALTGVPHAGAQSPPESATSEWRIDSAGAFHEASATKCARDLDGFDALSYSGPADPNVLGTCTYKDNSDGYSAGVQVRRYMRNVGVSRVAADNDRMLMEPRPGTPVPFMAVRFEPLNGQDGKKGGRTIITKTRNGFLIDCFGEAETLEAANAKIARVCAN